MTTFFQRTAAARWPTGLFVATTLHVTVANAQTANDVPKNEGAIVVVGTRGQPRSSTESSTPIDVVSASRLAEVGGSGTQLREALVTLIPSFKVENTQNLSRSALIRPAGLRGLSGAHVLILVNGKRWHNSSSSIPTQGKAAGANPVDLDTIPTSNIARIEVLRDGAAAQYGSDAVAGVINIVLKSSPDGGDLSLLAGQRYKFQGRNDGRTAQVQVDHGFRLPNDGFIHVGLQGLAQDWTFRAKEATGSFYFPINGAPDPREATVNKVVFRGGLPKVKSISGSYNAEMPIDDVTLYSFGAATIRSVKNGTSFRLPNTTSVLPELYTDVVQPTGLFPETDYQVAMGLRGSAAGWNWDLSSTFGQDYAEYNVEDTLNPSLGPTSPTSFKGYAARFWQWTNNFDVNRSVDIGLAAPLTVALGAEYRHEGYHTVSKDPLAYTNGGYIFRSGPLAGQPGPIGAQGLTNILPEDTKEVRRNVIAAYVDLATQPLPGWQVGVAAAMSIMTTAPELPGAGGSPRDYKSRPVSQFAVLSATGSVHRR